MAVRTLAAITFSAPVTFPTAGYGGSYYDSPTIQLPTYDPKDNGAVSWRVLDSYMRIVINKTFTVGIAAGLTWATFIYVLALTPNRKRTSPFHSFLLLGVAFLLAHLMIDIISAWTPGLSKYAAYTSLVSPSSVIFTTRYISLQAASLVMEVVSYCCASVCLWLQAQSLMIGIRARFLVCYQVILGYLILTSVSTFAAQLVYIINTTQQIGAKMTVEEKLRWVKLLYAYHCVLAVSIGSYSLVSMLSIVSIIWKRPSSLVKGHNAYASALNLMGLLCAQSFVLPFLFCILLVATHSEAWVDPSVMLLPTVYLIVPLGTLFMSINQKATETQRSAGVPNNKTHSMLALSPTEPKHPTRDRSPTMTEESGPSSSLTAFLLDVDGGQHRLRVPGSPCSDIDRELAAIDSIDSTLVESRTRNSQTKANLCVESGTPRPDSCVLSEKMI